MTNENALMNPESNSEVANGSKGPHTRRWITRQQLLVGIVTAVVGLLLGGLVQHEFGIFSPGITLPTYKSSITTTERILFSPFLNNPEPPKTHGNANCWLRSFASPRPDAYRCSARHEVYDPCFAVAFRNNILVCPTAPWNSRYLVLKAVPPLADIPREDAKLHVTNGLSHPSPVPSSITSIPHYVWAVELTNGARCFRLTGGAIGQENLTVDFVCSNNGQTVGSVNRISPLWSVIYFGPTSNQGIVVGIAKAWF